MSYKGVKAWDDLQLKDNYMFSAVMRNPELCRKALERILGFEIERIEYVSIEYMIKISPDSKGIRLDVYAKDPEHKVFDLEMHILSLFRRSLYVFCTEPI